MMDISRCERKFPKEPPVTFRSRVPTEEDFTDPEVLIEIENDPDLSIDEAQDLLT